MANTVRLTPMHGFPLAVAHVEQSAGFVQVGGIALGLDGEGADRRLVLMLRHADGTGLAAYLTDPGMGRLGDLICELYGPAVVAAATTPQGSVQ